MNIFLKKTVEIYFKQIKKLLQFLSNFYGYVSNLRFIWNSFFDKENVFAIFEIVSSIILIDKFLYGFGFLQLPSKIRGDKIGFIEDITIKESHRKKGLFRLILDDLINNAKKKSNYKLLSDCKEKTKTFYKKLVFKYSGNTVNLII